ncbi:MAG: hypothetical protein AAF481_04790 [Acidobacteriota bacterium]
MLRVTLTSLAVLVMFSTASFAGTYARVDARSAIPPSDPDFMQPFAIVHPPNYSGGFPGVVPIMICVRPEDPQLVPAVQMAIETWNRLEPMTGNCENCTLWEEPISPGTTLNAFSTVLHEMGHCAMGLGHPDLREATRAPIETATGTCDVDEDSVCGESTSFTNSGNATQIVTVSGIRGSSDNDHQNSCPVLGDPPKEAIKNSLPLSGDDLAIREAACARLAACPVPPNCCPACPGPDCPAIPLETIDFSWYRLADNDPFVIDSTVIDRTTFSRRRDLLPTGHSYAANANRGLADSLGVPNTQSVMYSLLDPGAKRKALAADDVNMVKMGMTGVDREAGNEDDYTIALVFETECLGATIEVSLTDRFITLPEQNGICAATVRKSFSNSVHYSQTPITGQSKIFIELNPSNTWDFSVPLIFRGHFETGDLSEWSNSSQGP